MTKTMTLGQAEEIAGALNFGIKMPGSAYSLPATACILGAKLAKIPGTVCSNCYALKDRHAWPKVRKGHERHLEAIHHPLWVEAMVRLLLHKHRDSHFRIDLGVVNAKARGIQRWRWNEAGYHRWHSAGDLQSVEHLAKICEVARRTPKIRHWLPSNELGMVRRYVDGGGVIPANLVIRISSIMVDDTKRRAWPNTSSVIAQRGPSEGAHECPAPKQGNECRACRACWSPNVGHVSYHQH